jgi:hypothetical protein
MTPWERSRMGRIDLPDVYRDEDRPEIRDDVLTPAPAGYLPCLINSGGYIFAEFEGFMVHRETRDMHLGPGCKRTLEEARNKVAKTGNGLVVQLSPAGRGEAVWMHKDQEKLIVPRMKKWKGCYGLWPVSFFSEA